MSTGKSDEAAVKSLGAGSTNALGLYDMSGTVWEWCFTESGSNRINRGANKKIIERKVEFFQQDGPAYWSPQAGSVMKSCAAGGRKPPNGGALLPGTLQSGRMEKKLDTQLQCDTQGRVYRRLQETYRRGISAGGCVPVGWNPPGFLQAVHQ